MFSDSASETVGIIELNGNSWKEKSAQDAAKHRNILVAFYQPNTPETKELKEALQKFAKEFASHGYMEVGSMNCGRLQGVCQKEKLQKLPTVVYYGPEGSQPQRHPSGPITSEALTKWAAKVMGDHCKVLEHQSDLRRWLETGDKEPKVVFLTDRKSVPPLFKALSLEFAERASLGVVLKGKDDALNKVLGVESRPALLHITDEESLESVKFDKEFKKEHVSRFLSRAVGRHRSEAAYALRELTAERFANGECAPSDSRFCLLLISHTATLAPDVKASLRQLAERLRSDRTIQVFFVRNRAFAKAFGRLQPDTVVLYRPKRRRFKVFDGAATDGDALATFVDSAVGGGAPLPNSLPSSPSFSAGARPNEL